MGGLKPVNWIQWLTLMTVVTIGIIVPVLIVQINNVQRHQNDALRTILCFSEARIRISPTLTPKQRRDAIKFYDDALARIDAKPCH
jgi:hypothetical protein